MIGTDPLVADTDSDGLNDGDEVDNGTDPLQKEPTTGPTKVSLFAYFIFAYFVYHMYCCKTSSQQRTMSAAK